MEDAKTTTQAPKKTEALSSDADALIDESHKDGGTNNIQFLVNLLARQEEEAEAAETVSGDGPLDAWEWSTLTDATAVVDEDERARCLDNEPFEIQSGRISPPGENTKEQ